MNPAFFISIGARGPKVEEPLCWVLTYPTQWREPRLNLAELAGLRWVEGWSTKELAEYFRNYANGRHCPDKYGQQIAYI